VEISVATGGGEDAMTVAWAGVLSTVLIVGMAMPAVAADTLPRKAQAKPAAIADRCVKAEPPPGTPSVPGGDIFGFTDPADIGDPCSWAFASENNGRAVKSDGSYFALTNKTEISYTYSSTASFSFSVFNSYTRWSNVTVAQDTLAAEGVGVFRNRWSRLDFDGLSGEVLVRLVTRAPGQPFSVTIGAEPRWSYVDFVTGHRADGYAAEFKLFIDVALTERLFAAVNLNYALGTQKFDIPNAIWERGSATNVSAALTAQIHAAEKQTIEGVFVGIEGRFRSVFDGLLLDRFAGNVFNFGPTFAIAFAGDRMLNVAWSPQLAGRVSPATPCGLNLTHFDRQEFRVKFVTPIGP
jgi:hypothetical protein